MILVVPVLGDALQRRSCIQREGRELSDLLSAVLPLHRRSRNANTLFFVGFPKALEGGACERVLGAALQ